MLYKHLLNVCVPTGQILVKISIFHVQLTINAPVEGDTVGISPRRLVREN